MSKTLNNSEVIITLLEQIIDIRYKYLKELDYENHAYARQIIEEQYRPVVKKFIELIDDMGN